MQTYVPPHNAPGRFLCYFLQKLLQKKRKYVKITIYAIKPERKRNMNKVKITICGREYNLKTDDSPAYIAGLAKKVDSAITEMMSSSSSMSMQSAAVLAALAAYDELEKANGSIDNIRSQIKEYVDDAGHARAERDKAVKKESELTAKIAALENELKIKHMKNDIDRQLSIDMTDTSAAEKHNERPPENRNDNRNDNRGGKHRR